MLYDQRKYDFRVYMVIVSTKPLIILYHDGYVRIAFNEYDPKSQDKKTHLTNNKINMADELFSNDPN